MFGESWTAGPKRMVVGALVAVLTAFVLGAGGYAAYFLLISRADIGDAMNFIGGIVGAAFGSGLAIAGAQYIAHGERHAARHATTSEVVRAAIETLAILKDASASFHRGTRRSKEVIEICSRAAFAEERLRRLISRPESTEQAIEIAVGAIAMMEIVRQAGGIIEASKGTKTGAQADDHLRRADVLRVAVRIKLVDISSLKPNRGRGRR